MERSVNYEIERQTAILEAGEKIKHETRGWDEGTQKTFSQREKKWRTITAIFRSRICRRLKISELGWEIDLPELPSEKEKDSKNITG